MNLPYCPVPGGHDEEIDRLNFFLFSGHSLDLVEGQQIDGVRIEVSSKPLFFGTRLFRVLRISREGGIPFILPFYRSTGRATPSSSPKGTFWPCSGVFPAEISPTGSEWIGKHFWSLSKGRWISHNKRKSYLPENLQKICAWLEEKEPAP